MQLKTLKDIKDLAGKRVLLRVDFNVPIKKDKKGKIIIIDMTKIREALGTVKILVENKAKVIIMSHFCRPDGKVVEDERLLPIAEKIVELLGGKKISLKPYKALKINTHTKFTYATDLIGKKVETAIGKMVDGDIILLENTRFYPEELASDPAFVKKIAALGDIYVNDAFAVSHRAEGTIVEITKYLPSYAGILLEKEMSALSRLLESPEKPYVAMIGGIKIKTKIAVIENLLPKIDSLCLGGGIANTFFRAMGYGVGDSIIDDNEIELAKKIIQLGKNKLILPIDVVVGDKEGKEVRVIDIEKEPIEICGKNEGIYDIGPQTIGEYALLIKKSKTVVWNGPFGLFEVEQYRHGSISLGRVIAAHSRGPAFGVVGGGETIACLAATGMSEYVDHVSTGGGAMLTFLEGKGLPGIKPLLK